jgi:activator of 2-hydroxyglutaryl-CoA dehydratase
MHDHLAGHEKKAPQLLQIAAAPYQKPHDHHTQFVVGLDVGSTTVKATVVDAATEQILWQDYQRHETKQPEKTLEFLRRMEAEVGINRHNTRMFMTGSGGGGIAEQIGAKFVQEVTAVPWPSRNSIPKCIRSLSWADRMRRSLSSRTTTKRGARKNPFNER